MWVYLSSADWSCYLLPVLKGRCEDLRELNAGVFPCREHEKQFVITEVNVVPFIMSSIWISCGCSVYSDIGFPCLFFSNS